MKLDCQVSSISVLFMQLVQDGLNASQPGIVTRAAVNLVSEMATLQVRSTNQLVAPANAVHSACSPFELELNRCMLVTILNWEFTPAPAPACPPRTGSSV